MEVGATWRRTRVSSYERLAAMGMVLLAVLSPLYIDRRESDEVDADEASLGVDTWLPLLLLLLISAIAISLFLDRSLSRFDPYWIHRVGGSSGGILVTLLVLALVLKCKASLLNWEA